MKPSFENRRIAQRVREDLSEYGIYLDDSEVDALAEWFEESDIAVAPSDPVATFTHAPPW